MYGNGSKDMLNDKESYPGEWGVLKTKGLIQSIVWNWRKEGNWFLVRMIRARNKGGSNKVFVVKS